MVYKKTFPGLEIHGLRGTNAIVFSKSSVGAWLSLVERLLRVQKVAGSNPVAPTIFR